MNKEEYIKRNKKNEEMKEEIKKVFSKEKIGLCVAVVLCAIVPAAAVNAVMRPSQKKEQQVILCQLSGGLMGMECHPTDRRVFLDN